MFTFPMTCTACALIFALRVVPQCLSSVSVGSEYHLLYPPIVPRLLQVPFLGTISENGINFPHFKPKSKLSRPYFLLVRFSESAPCADLDKYLKRTRKNVFPDCNPLYPIRTIYSSGFFFFLKQKGLWENAYFFRSITCFHLAIFHSFVWEPPPP